PIRPSSPTRRSSDLKALQSWLREKEPTGEALKRVGPLRRPADRSVVALALDYTPSVIVTGDRALVNRARALGLGSVSAPDMVQRSEEHTSELQSLAY